VSVPLRLDRTAFLRRMREVRAFRRGRRSLRGAPEPHAFIVSPKNAARCKEMYDLSPGEMKAALPLKKLSIGSATRFVAVPKLIDRYLESLPDA